MQGIPVMTFTQANVKAALQSLGLTFRKTSSDYRVSLQSLTGQANEDAAYYTDDIEDAYYTGLAMAKGSN